MALSKPSRRARWGNWKSSLLTSRTTDSRVCSFHFFPTECKWDLVIFGHIFLLYELGLIGCPVSRACPTFNWDAGSVLTVDPVSSRWCHWSQQWNLASAEHVFLKVQHGPTWSNNLTLSNHPIISYPTIVSDLLSSSMWASTFQSCNGQDFREICEILRRERRADPTRAKQARFWGHSLEGWTSMRMAKLFNLKHSVSQGTCTLETYIPMVWLMDYKKGNPWAAQCSPSPDWWGRLVPWAFCC